MVHGEIMSYSDFDLKKIKSVFNITIVENTDLFLNTPEIQISDLLKQLLNQNVPLALAIATEKASSELIIINILLELKRLCGIALFSGIEFNVDKELGLNGSVDFIISLSSEQLFLEAPVIALVEAKNEKIVSGLGQCIAEMLAAQRYNQQDNKIVPIIYGIVTTGQTWKFLKLIDQTVYIDIADYYINQPEKILGILNQMIKPS